jgi:RND family efflux transporter MFP subunit
MSKEDLSKLRIDKMAEQHAGRRKRRRAVFILFAALSASAALLLHSRGVFTPVVGVEIVSVSKVYPSQAFTLLNASGYVEAQRKAAVASKATGRLVQLSVEEGSRVKKGEVLARLESGDMAASLEQARANLNLARSDVDKAKADVKNASVSFERARSLLAQQFISKSDYDSAEARYDIAKAGETGAQAGVKAAEAAVRSAEVALEYTMIRAPFDAVVLTKNADIGDLVTPLGASANAKAAVVTIADMGSLQVEVDVSESNIHQVRQGQPCEIMLDALPDSRFRGAVHMIVPTADRTKASVMVKVRFLDKDVRVLPEMSAKVAFLQRPVGAGEDTPRIAVSVSAIRKTGGRNSVFLVTNGMAFESAVKTGQKLGDMIEVLDSLKPGDKVVDKPSDKLKSGMRVKVPDK